MDNLNTSRFRKIALILPILLLITGFFVMLALYVNVKHSQKETSQPCSARVCSSKQCLRSAGDLAFSMDNTVRPCDNFYQYVCGNWPSEHPLFSSWFEYKQVQVLALVQKTLAKNTTGQPNPVKHARDFYASCMDTGDIEKVGLNHVFDVLESVNLPLLPTILNISGDADSSTSSFDWVDTVIKIKTQLDMHVFIGFDIKHTNSFENNLCGFTETSDRFPRSYKNVLKFSNNYRQSSLPLSNNESIKMCIEDKHNTDDEEQQKKNANFENQISYSEEYNILKKYVKNSGIGMKVNDNILHEKIIETLKQYTIFNAEIEALQGGKTNIKDFIYQAYILFVENILSRYLKHLFDLSSVTFDREKDKIVFTDDVTFVSVVRSVSKAPPKLIELYIWMKVVKALDRHTSTEKQARSLYCSRITDEVLGMAVAFPIVEPHINVIRPKVHKMINEIKKSLHQSISKAEWMDEKTKQASYEKITKMKSLAGIPEWFYEIGKLEEYYEGVEIRRDHYFKNLVNVVQARLRKHLNKFREPDYFLWSLDPSTANAVYNNMMNSISVPMVMLQHPFFDLGLDSLNYGNLGVILGHEITHGFDNNGREFDKNGNIVQWWSDDSIRHYVNLTQCFVDQYSSFCVPGIHKYVDGTQTLGENIADNGGLNQALAALKRRLQKYGPEEKLPGFEHVSSEQMFFLSFAHAFCGISTEENLNQVVTYDVHSPLELRVRGTLQNSEEFARAWNCPLGSPMNPRRERCVLF